MARLIFPSNKPGDRAAWLPLYWWERCCIVLIAAAIVVYGMALMVGAETTEQKTGELQSALRAGWAVRTQKPIYDETPLPFTGPPILAALVSPLAHPPAGEDTTGYVPVALSVAVSYFFNCMCLILAIHWLAGAVEAGSTDPLAGETPAGCRRWWYHRALPVLVLAAPLSAGVASGSCHAVTVLLISGMLLCLIRKQPFGAGVLLGGAMCLQVVTALLILIAICRRDRLMTLGTVFGLALGMLVLPGLVFGLQHTNELNVKYFELLMQTGMDHVLAGLRLAGTLLVWAICTYLLKNISFSAASAQQPVETETPQIRKVA